MTPESSVLSIKYLPIKQTFLRSFNEHYIVPSTSISPFSYFSLKVWLSIPSKITLRLLIPYICTLYHKVYIQFQIVFGINEPVTGFETLDGNGVITRPSIIGYETPCPTKNPATVTQQSKELWKGPGRVPMSPVTLWVSRRHTSL